MQLGGVEYELREKSLQDGVEVWKAREKASYRLVLIHIFPPAKQSAANGIVEKMMDLPFEARNKVFQFGPFRDATCFVTDLLPEGESLQQWIGRQGGPQKPPAGSPVRVGAVNDLRKLDIEPAAVVPLPPGPDGRSGDAPAGSFTELYSAERIADAMQARPAPAAAPQPVAKQSTVDSWSKLYGPAETRTFAPVTPEPALAPEPEPARSKPSNSLESFIFPKSDIVAPSAPEPASVVSVPPERPRPAPPPLPEPPPMIVRRHDSPSPPPPRPLPLFDPPPVPGPEAPPVFSPIELPGANSPYSPEPRVRPMPAAATPYSQPRPGASAMPVPHSAVSPTVTDKPHSGSAIDWRIVLVVILVLIVAGGALVAIVESAG